INYDLLQKNIIMRILFILLFTLFGTIAISQFVINPYIYATTPPVPSVDFDTDALAYISETGITDSTIIYAVYSLTKDLKNASLWTKRKNINPAACGTATTNKYNLKDNRDLDTSYRLTFTGTVTHSANGMIASTPYGNTYYNPSTVYPT